LNSYLNLVLAIINLCQSYQRTNDNKEATLRRALAFMLNYVEDREDRLEVRYNVARMLHYLS